MSRWSRFRTSEDSIPANPFEAGVFLQNARLHLINSDPIDWDSRRIILAAHEEVNRTFFDDKRVSA